MDSIDLQKKSAAESGKPILLDLFSGAGGFSLGFELAGCSAVCAVEADKWASETYAFNHPSANVLSEDIRSVSSGDIRVNVGCSPDIIIGGPPCQGFSVCTKNAGDPSDPRNSLFREFLRIGKAFSPKAMVMENVPNIVRAKTSSGEGVVDVIQKEFERLGYSVYSAILNAPDYGIPQMRKRFFLIASERALDHPFPERTHCIRQSIDGFLEELEPCPVLWDAISDLPEIEAGEGAEKMAYSMPPQTEYEAWCRKGSAYLHNHKAMNHTRRLVERFAVLKCGQSVSDITDERLKQRRRNGGGRTAAVPYDQNNRRMHPFRLCQTVTASFSSSFVHPYRNRNFTPREGARIQSFPDTYVFLGKPTTISRKLAERKDRMDEFHLCQYSQIGNAVPPLLAKALAENLLKELNLDGNGALSAEILN